MINITKLTEEALVELLQNILENIAKEEPNLEKEDVEFILDSLINALDTLSEDDGLGTEGWEHYFNINFE